MQWTGLNELREKYLSFFESKGHLRLDSFPLVPKNDPSLLLINSGMAPMKKWFLAQEEPPRHRVTTCQKCIRTPDIERVGITARHGTFFEMLGNFSFQDYFKDEVIPWAWEFLTSDEWMAIPKDRLHISVYEEDDEAYDIWTKKVGIAPDHMVRLGKEDNFWEHGSGPCGPCSEIYFDRGPEYGCGKPTCGVGCDCDRYMEIWNLVFSQFDADGKGHYERLARPNIDTGMGLERLACVMQNVGNLFEVDTVQSVLHHVEHIAGKTYKQDPKTDISIRVITDHIRSCTFMVSDGILPSNEGRGYVLRRLLRRAARHGRMLGIDHPFLVDLVETVIQSSESAYPELREHDAYIKKVIGTEEANFARTIDAGMNILNNMIDRLEKAHQKLLSGMDAFKLNDTFGFPLDLTKEIAAEQGLEIDEDGFHAEMKKQKERARAERLKKNISGWSEDLFGGLTAEPTVFTGYDTLNDNSVVVALMLIVYGVAFILIERRPRVPTTTKLSRITYPQAFKVGCWQVLSLIPGTSRSGSTILGGMLCGMSRPAASQFTFFLAIPVMAGASLLKLVKFFGKGNSFTLDQTVVLIVGCAVAFIVSIIAIRFLMDYVKRHNFKFFGLYRIVLGLIVLAVAAITAIA